MDRSLMRCQDCSAEAVLIHGTARLRMQAGHRAAEAHSVATNFSWGASQEG